MIGEILIIFVFFALLILLFPVKLSVNSARINGKIDGFFGISWIIFIFSYSFRESRFEIKILKKRLAGYSHKGELSEIKEISDKQIASKKKKKSKKILPYGDIFDLIRPMFQLLKDLIKCFHFEDINIKVKFGANDPAYTGILTGIFYAMTSYFQSGNKIRLAVDFERPCLEWDMVVKAAFTPIRMLPVIMRFITDRRVLKSGFRMISG